MVIAHLARTVRALSCVACLFGRLIGGIILGIIGMFQPWIFEAFRYGFYLLLASTIGYIAWSHVSPAEPEDETAEILGIES